MIVLHCTPRLFRASGAEPVLEPRRHPPATLGEW
jgi:hypothetical protein